MRCIISQHRGFTIAQLPDGSFEALRSGLRYCTSNTAWSCIAYIDELLSP